MQSFKQFYFEAYQEVAPGVVKWIDDDVDETFTSSVFGFKLKTRDGPISGLEVVPAASLSGACHKSLLFSALIKGHTDSYIHSRLGTPPFETTAILDFVARLDLNNAPHLINLYKKDKNGLFCPLLLTF